MDLDLQRTKTKGDKSNYFIFELHSTSFDINKECTIAPLLVNTEDRYGLVLFLDGLGTKGMSREKQNRIETVACYNSFLKIMQSSIDENKIWFRNKFEHMMKDLKFEISAFSDTVVITGSYDPVSRKIDKENRDSALISISGRVVAEILIVAMENGIYLRGCVSIGEFTKSLDPKHFIILGDPVNEAAGHYESAEWMGVSASPSVHKIITHAASSPFFHSKDWISHDLPLKNFIETSAWVINWPTYFKHKEQSSRVVRLDLIKKRRELVWKKSQEASDLIDAVKWRNTLQFFDRSVNTYVTAKGKQLVE
jgi:hypothetical protein